MSQLVLTSDTLITSPATGTLEYNGQFYGTDSNSARAQMQRITQGTAVPYSSFTTTTYNDFTGIPAWVKRITVLFQGLSVSGTSNIQVQIGYQSPVTSSGYSGGVSIATTAVSTLAYANGFYLTQQNVATWAHSGSMTITNIGSNTWVANSVVGNATTLVGTNVGGGFITLSGVLDRVRITTINTTDTFDAGSINILYEG